MSEETALSRLLRIEALLELAQKEKAKLKQQIQALHYELNHYKQLCQKLQNTEEE